MQVIDRLKATGHHDIAAHVETLTASAAHARSVALIRFLSRVARTLRVAEHVYVVGGAVRDFYMDRPIKDIDVVVDSVALKGRDSDWFARQVERQIPAPTNLTTNQYGVAILTVQGEWMVDGEDLRGEVIEVANARKESYGGEEGKGYKPHQVEPATILEDLCRREFTYNCLLWSLHDVAKGPDKKAILDLTGKGLKDLDAGLLRTPVDPDKTFTDDPTRMLRAVKFAVRYGHRLSPDAEKSIWKNRDRLLQVPQNAIATLLLGTLLQDSNYKEVLGQLERLGLLETIGKLLRRDQGFRATVQRWLRDRRVLMMLDLMRVLPVDSVGFLSRAQQEQLREQALELEPRESKRLLAALKQPGKTIDMAGLIKQFGLKGSAITRLQDVARQVILDRHDLLGRVKQLTRLTQEEYQGSVARVTATGPVYAAAFLTERASRKLLAWWAREQGQVLSVPVAHHATIQFRPTPDQMGRLRVGEKVTLQVVGAAESDLVQAVVVQGVDAEDRVAHVTVAVEPPGQPKDAKLVVQQAERVRGPRLEATIGYFESGRVVTAAGIRALHLFDFDGTLFRSPGPPQWWDRNPKAWWSFPESLEPPCVPERPGPEWWVADTVRAARKSIASPDVFALLCTGRLDRPFRWRVPELLKQKGLGFDKVLLNPTTGSTRGFKKQAMAALHRRHQFDHVEIWEDRHLTEYQPFVEKEMGLECRIHKVVSPVVPARCPAPG